MNDCVGLPSQMIGLPWKSSDLLYHFRSFYLMEPKTKPVYKAFQRTSDGKVKILQVRYGGGSRVLFSVGSESIWLDRAQLADLVKTLDVLYRSVLKEDFRRLAEAEMEYLAKQSTGELEQKVFDEEPERIDLNGSE